MNATTPTIHELIELVASTREEQCASWKAALRKLLMETVYRYTDACVATPYSSKKVAETEEDLEAELIHVFHLIPEREEEEVSEWHKEGPNPPLLDEEVN